MPNVVLNFAYDYYDNLTSVSDNLGGQLSYTYDAAHRMTKAQYGTSSYQPNATFGYDADSRMTDLETGTELVFIRNGRRSPVH